MRGRWKKETFADLFNFFSSPVPFLLNRIHYKRRGGSGGGGGHIKPKTPGVPNILHIFTLSRNDLCHAFHLMVSLFFPTGSPYLPTFSPTCILHFPTVHSYWGQRHTHTTNISRNTHKPTHMSCVSVWTIMIRLFESFLILKWPHRVKAKAVYVCVC